MTVILKTYYSKVLKLFVKKDLVEKHSHNWIITNMPYKNSHKQWSLLLIEQKTFQVHSIHL